MEKIKLNLTNVKEVLSREQLRQVVGGTGSIPDTGTGCKCSCTYMVGTWNVTCGGPTSGNSTYCKTEDNKTPGPFTCTG